MHTWPSAVHVVAIPGRPGCEVLCRTPPIGTLYLDGLLQLPLLQAVLGDAAAGQDGAVWIRDDPEEKEARRQTRLDRWVCHALLEPKAVLEPPVPADALSVQEIDTALKLAIYDATAIPPPPRALFEFVSAGEGRLPMLDTMAQRYGRTPADIIGIAHPAHALDFNLALAAHGDVRDHEESVDLMQLLAVGRATR